MSGKRVSMRKIREVLRLTHELRLSVREVRAATGIGKTAVSEYVRRAKVIGITWPIPEDLDDVALEKRLFDLPGESARPGHVARRYTLFHAALAVYHRRVPESIQRKRLESSCGGTNDAKTRDSFRGKFDKLARRDSPAQGLAEVPSMPRFPLSADRWASPASHPESAYRVALNTRRFLVSRSLPAAALANSSRDFGTLF